ncbi:FAD-dependent oxidoreductase [Paenibacillus eucommiae]|uniref:FAD-dependent oxidoreductase n=1 Tax=Paenibacillus eucommiae TaxID=1355755 RepID=A0ABS4J0S7_9BACL|nr:FAD-dependent oxidoreductase [Paenibacillus eucommiae]MBP1993439.1 hypothetical protein [Paenibacillus eucommiae]
MKRFVQVFTMLLLSVVIVLSGCGKEDSGNGGKETVNDPNKPDVVLIGSEIEGMYLARAARDEGLSVVVLDPRELPGGQLLEGEMLFLDEPFDDAGKSLLQGRVKQLFDKYKTGEIRKKSEFVDYFHELAEGIPIESGITIVSIATEQDSATSKEKIASLTYRTAEGEEKTLAAPYWVENTDFTALTSKLKGNRIPGAEVVFGGTKDYMASSYIMKFKNVDWKEFQKSVNALSKEKREELYGGNTNVTDTFTWGFGNIGKSYTPTHEDIYLRGLNIVNQLDGEVLINALLTFGVDPSDNESIAIGVKNGQAETQQILKHFQKELPGWENAEINGFPNYLYIRDYDRYETEYVLQAVDLLRGTMFDDNVSIAGYSIDLQGTKNNPWGTSPGKPDKYGMPLRSFILKDYANVLVAGKNVGASAVAYGSARIQPNTSLAGEVIGIMLGQMDKKSQISTLSKKEIKKLQQYVEKNYDIKLLNVQAKNKIADYSKEELEEANKGKLRK